MTPAARKETILAAIVESFIQSGEPVGSKALLGGTGLQVSSATVRNDMAELTAQGYLVQPHTSAGRIPTALGYRYYVDNVMRVTPLAQVAAAYIRDSLGKLADSPEMILQGAADLTEQLTGSVALATTPAADNCRVRRLSFVQTGRHTAMAVLICSNGVIRTRLFRCAFVITPEIITMFDKSLNELFAGVEVGVIGQPFIQSAAVRFGELSLFMPPALIAIMEAAQQSAKVSVKHSKLSRLIFNYGASASVSREFIDFLQNERDVAAMLSRRPQHTAVTIGTENRRVELSKSAVFSTRYSIDGTPSGVLAIITAQRTDYARNIAIIECVAQCAGELMEELIETTD